MIQSRKQSTTDYPIVFLMVDSSDHVTGKTGLTPTVTLSKNGGAFGAAAGAVIELANGWYSLAGNAIDRNTLGSLAIHVSASGADPCDLLVLITSYDPFIDVSSILSKTDNLPSDPADQSLVEAAIASIPAGVTAAEVWSHPSRSLTNLTQVSNLVVEGLEITSYRGDVFSATLEVADMGVSEPSKIWIGVKGSLHDADEDALLLIDLTGLLVLLGRDPVTGETATITWIDSTHVQLDISAEAMSLLPVGSYLYDVQIENVDITTVANGPFNILGDVVREV